MKKKKLFPPKLNNIFQYLFLYLFQSFSEFFQNLYLGDAVSSLHGTPTQIENGRTKVKRSVSLVYDPLVFCKLFLPIFKNMMYTYIIQIQYTYLYPLKIQLSLYYGSKIIIKIVFFQKQLIFFNTYLHTQFNYLHNKFKSKPQPELK